MAVVKTVAIEWCSEVYLASCRWGLYLGLSARMWSYIVVFLCSLIVILEFAFEISCSLFSCSFRDCFALYFRCFALLKEKGGVSEPLRTCQKVHLCVNMLEKF